MKLSPIADRSTEPAAPLNFDRWLAKARALPPGDDAVWRGHRLIWKEPETWMPRLTAWLTPHFRRDWHRRLKPGTFRDICWDDDPEWFELLARCSTGDVEARTEALAEALASSVLRAFHGCRTDDAGTYFRGGLRVHDRAEMTARLRAFVEAHTELHWMKPGLDKAIAEIDNTYDVGRLHVVADDQCLLRDAAHYLIYGSEWITAVLGTPGRDILKRTGVPTLLEIDLPLNTSRPAILKAFATRMLCEWTRLTCNNPGWSAPIDFTFTLRADIPPAHIVGHSHPLELRDPLDRERIHRTLHPVCRHCAPVTA